MIPEALHKETNRQPTEQTALLALLISTAMMPFKEQRRPRDGWGRLDLSQAQSNLGLKMNSEGWKGTGPRSRLSASRGQPEPACPFWLKYNKRHDNLHLERMTYWPGCLNLRVHVCPQQCVLCWELGFVFVCFFQTQCVHFGKSFSCLKLMT